MQILTNFTNALRVMKIYAGLFIKFDVWNANNDMCTKDNPSGLSKNSAKARSTASHLVK